VARRLSYVPLIAPVTSEDRMKILCKIADSFIYVVSRVGVTGATGKLSSGLPALLDRVHQYSNHVPAAVGIGVSTREQFLEVGSIAEGVLIGSQIITTLANSPAGQGAHNVEEYCSEITGRKVGRHMVTNVVTKEMENEKPKMNGHALENGHGTSEEPVHTDEVIKPGQNGSGPGLAAQLEALNMDGGGKPAMPSRFGEFGGQYVPESLMDCLAELEAGFNEARNDSEFWEEYRSHSPYMGRPTQLHRAERLTEHAGGPNIWLKREDLNHTGAIKLTMPWARSYLQEG